MSEVVGQCAEPDCTAPTYTTRSFTMSGVGYTGADITIHCERRACFNGHSYDVEIFEEERHQFS